MFSLVAKYYCTNIYKYTHIHSTGRRTVAGETHNYEAGASAEPADKRFLCDLCPEAFVHMR